MLIIRRKLLLQLKSSKFRRYFSNRSNKSNTTSALIQREDYAPTSIPEHPWSEVKTADGQIYYWNKSTNETTPVGAAKPDPWVSIRTKQGTYYHNLATNQTTALGSPLPPRYGGIQEYQYQQLQPPVTLGRSIMTYATLGFGMSIGIALINSLFR